MSMGEEHYNEQVKMAAYFVATTPNRDKWTYSNGIQLAFVAEYY